MARKTEFHRLAETYGYQLKRSSSHLIWVHTITKFVVTTAKTASDFRAVKNAEANFRRGAALAA